MLAVTCFVPQRRSHVHIMRTIAVVQLHVNAAVKIELISNRRFFVFFVFFNTRCKTARVSGTPLLYTATFSV